MVINAVRQLKLAVRQAH